MNLVKKPESSAVSDQYMKTITELEYYVKSMPDSFGKDPFPLKHSFAEGVYIRELFIPKGNICIGALHKDSYTNIILYGDMSIITDEGFKRITGASTVISPPMTKRFGYSHADTMWVTVHPNPTNSTNIEELEAEIHLKSYEGFESLTEEDISNESKHIFGRFTNYINEIDCAFDMERFRYLTLSLHTNEKDGFWSDWSKKEKSLYMSGDWEAFSVERGYSLDDIDDLKEWIDLYEIGVLYGINPLEGVVDILARSAGTPVAIDGAR